MFLLVIDSVEKNLAYANNVAKMYNFVTMYFTLSLISLLCLSAY